MKIEMDERTSEQTAEEQELQVRGNFLRSLGKWSLAVIGCATLSSLSAPSGAAWANMRIKRANGSEVASDLPGRSASWVNGGGDWTDRGVSVVAGSDWVNGQAGETWVDQTRLVEPL